MRAGFGQLDAGVRDVKGFPDGPMALQRAAEVYIGFAQRTPALFRLMFSRELVDASAYPDAAAAGAVVHRAGRDGWRRGSARR